MFTFCSHSLEHMMYGIGRIVLELLTAPHVECGRMSEWLLESRPLLVRTPLALNDWFGGEGLILPRLQFCRRSHQGAVGEGYKSSCHVV
jgi:hypothetical protein